MTHHPAPPLPVMYINYRGEASFRNIRPIRVYYGSTEWHPEPQWIMQAYDLDKDAVRDFAMKDMYSAKSAG